MPRPAPDPGWAVPPYAVSLRDVLPALIRSLGVDPAAGDPDWPQPAIQVPAARTAVVVLVDGLGARQLARRSGHAPYLRALAPLAPEVRSGFPSTTAVSLAALGTAALPGEHGLVGWQVRLPGTDRLLNHLSWDGGPEPTAYQPLPTLLERAVRAGVQVSTVSQPAFQGSGLTRAALRGGRFVPARSLQERVRATLGEVARGARPGGRPGLVYLYIGEVDKAGHEHGPDSLRWGETVEEVDAALAALGAGLPPGTSLTVTADHGMVEAPEALRRDIAHDRRLGEGVALLGGEPRVPYAYCEPGAAGDVLDRWRTVLGSDAVVLSRAEIVEAGWLGPVRDEVLARIGDVVAVLRGGGTVLDSRLLRPQVLALRGHHGSLTDEETLIPLLHTAAA